MFYQNPVGSEGNALPPLSVTLFNPSFDKDRFENTALTITGKIGDLKAIYSGAYLVRNVEQVQDYTNYARGVWATYYQCTGYSTGFDPPTKCYTPSATWHDKDRTTHQSHEFRLSTPDDKRLRGPSRRCTGRISRSTIRWTISTGRCRPARRRSTTNASSMSSRGPVSRQTTQTFATRTMHSSTMYSAVTGRPRYSALWTSI